MWIIMECQRVWFTKANEKHFTKTKEKQFTKAKEKRLTDEETDSTCQVRTCDMHVQSVFKS